MFNSVVNYTLIQDGVKTENSFSGKLDSVGSFNRVVFLINDENETTEHTYVTTGEDSFKISVKGSSGYAITVKRGEINSATIKADGVLFDFEVDAEECLVVANDSGLSIYAKYYLVAYGQRVKNELTLNVCKRSTET